MTGDSHISMSQGLDVLKPKSGTAYPIPCAEWAQLKTNLGAVSGSPFVFGSVGFTLVGASLATLINIWTETIPAGIPRIVAWAVVVVTLVLGIAFIIIADQQDRFRKRQISDVIAQMTLIENRYLTLGAPTKTADLVELVVTKASYAGGEKSNDVTALLNFLVENNSLEVRACNEYFSDPLFGVGKTLTVEYTYKGKPFKKSVAEGEELKIP